KDLTAFIKKGEASNRSLAVVEKFKQIEEFFLATLHEEEATYNLKELNEKASEAGCKDVSPNKVRTIINFWAIKNWIKRRNLEYSRNHVQIAASLSRNELKDKMVKRHFLARFIVEYLYQKAINNVAKNDADEI